VKGKKMTDVRALPRLPTPPIKIIRSGHYWHFNSFGCQDRKWQKTIETRDKIQLFSNASFWYEKVTERRARVIDIDTPTHRRHPKSFFFVATRGQETHKIYTIAIVLMTPSHPKRKSKE
jgi:hypothetical protein